MGAPAINQWTTSYSKDSKGYVALGTVFSIGNPVIVMTEHILLPQIKT